MNKLVLNLSVIILLFSCATKKDVLLFQDKEKINASINYIAPKIQVNDILSIKVSALNPELASPYNINSQTSSAVQLETLKLQGYLVGTGGTISFPILGVIKVAGKTAQELEVIIIDILEKGNHLLDPKVNVRLLNGKVTVLGEVNAPGTYSFTEQNISVLQAIGMAGDLTIKAKRKEVLLIREVDGQRSYTTLDLTQADWFSSDYFYVKQNDVIVVNPNGARIKNAGYVSEPSTLISMASIILSIVIILTR
jgi:polysaccharide export outer membrane protein